MDVRMFTVGPVAENTYIFRREGSDRALIVDPGDEAELLLNAIRELGVTLDGILLTHTHFDHVGAVAPVAKATGAEVWVPEIEKFVLADINSFVPWPDFGPFESYDAEHTLKGGEKLELAGFEIDVVFTPGHSPGHVTFSIPDEEAKHFAWAHFTGERDASNYEIEAAGRGMWRSGQEHLTRDYVERYFADLPGTVDVRSGWVLADAARDFFPRLAVDRATVARAQGLATDDSLDLSLRRALVDSADDLERALRVRHAFWD